MLLALDYANEAGCEAAADSPPNVVLIITDDQGCTGTSVATATPCSRRPIWTDSTRIRCAWSINSPPEFAAPYEEQFGAHVGRFFGMIANIDHNVGRLRTFLEGEGLASHTIFVFTSDSGTGAGQKVFNAGMRGRKQSEYDGGHRGPLFVHWPTGGLVSGQDVEPITAHVDVLPTLIDLAGIAGPN